MSFDYRIFDALSEGVQVIDQDWRYRYANDVVVRQGQHAREDLIGNTMMEVYPGIEETPVFAALQTCMKRREPGRTTNDFVLPDGSRQYFQLRIEPLPDGSILVFSSDVTAEEAQRVLMTNMAGELEALVAHRTATQAGAHAELEKQRQELENLASRLALATEVSQTGVWDWSITHGDLLWDARMHEIYEWDGEPSYDVWQERLHPDDRDETLAALQRCVDGDADFTATFRLVAPSGVRHIRALARRHDRHGEARIIGINWDRTREVMLADQLRQSEAVLSDFVDHAPAAIAMCDREMRYLAVSKRWRADYDLGDQKLIGRSHYEVFPHLPPSWKPVHQRVLAGGIDVADEAAFPQPDGSTQWISWEVRPWRDKDGAIGGLTMFTRDITALKQLTVDLAQRSAALERSNRTLEGFAYAASHDLREPLRGITGCTTLLQELLGDQLDDDCRELMGLIVDSAERMSRLIRDLLEYSRAGKLTIEPVDLNACADEAVARLEQVAKESEAIIEVDSLPGTHGDRGQLTTLFQNLIGNAIKYCGEAPPHIRISARSENGMVEVCVRDNGLGIEPRHRKQIFELFQRLHPRDEYSGTGIGLALCRRIVEEHGGMIHVDGVDGPGSVFVIALPQTA